MKKKWVLDTDEVCRLHKAGWSTKGLARHFNVPHLTVIRALGPDPDFDDPTLRARWQAKMPAIKERLRRAILLDVA